MPPLSAALLLCRKCGVDVDAAMSRFWPPLVSAGRDLNATDLTRWLDAQRGQEPYAAVARRSNLSRYQTTRILRGDTEPRLHQFFSLVETINGRLSDLLAEFVNINQLEHLRDRHRRTTLSRRLAFEEPWTSAFLSALECVANESRAEAEQRLKEAFGLSILEVREHLQQLIRAGLVARRKGGYVLEAPLVIDTGTQSEQARRLVRHWADLGAKRSLSPSPTDVFSYNVFSVSRADLTEIARMQREHFQRVRAIIAKSPPETVAVMNLQLIEFDLYAQKT